MTHPQDVNQPLKLQVRGLGNVRLIEGDARIGLAEVFEEGSLAHVQILFPDPWPKSRHHRRRLIQQDFVSLIVSKLALAGTLRLATDDARYAREMLRIGDAEPLLRNLAGEGMFVASAEERPKTRFEQRGEALGNEIFEMLFERVGARHASPVFVSRALDIGTHTLPDFDACPNILRVPIFCDQARA